MVFFLTGKRSAGFTLLEVMVAVTIIAIALITLFGSQSQSVSLVCESRFYTTAPLLAQEKMSELLVAGLGDAADDSGDYGEDFPGYRWRVALISAGAGVSPGIAGLLKGVEVAVSWGKPERYHFLLTRYVFDDADQ